MPAILKKGEVKAYSTSDCNRVLEIAHNMPYYYYYDNEDNFFLVVDGISYPEVSTAFDFID